MRTTSEPQKSLILAIIRGYLRICRITIKICFGLYILEIILSCIYRLFLKSLCVLKNCKERIVSFGKEYQDIIIDAVENCRKKRKHDEVGKFHER
jgi:hypothetical protein